MKVLVVSGFLGAGKTRFIKELVRRTRRDFVVLENEYADIGVDGGRLKEDVSVWELTEGCICCSVKSDFAASVLTISNTLAPEFLVVEPTGVGLLSAVLENIGRIAYERIEVLSPVALVDVHCFDEYLKTFDAFYADQIRNAGTLLISKAENSPPERVAAVAAELRGLNTEADIPQRHYSEQPQEWWEALLSKPRAGERAFTDLEGHPELSQVGYSGFTVNTMNEFLLKLQLLMRGNLGRVYRAKGCFSVQGQWASFDLVKDRYAIEPCAPSEESKMVIIGADLNEKYLHKLFVQNERLFQ